MPPLQVVPAVPSFGEKLAETLERAGVNIAQGYAKKLENQKVENTFALLNNPNATALQKLAAISSLPAERQKFLGRPLAAVLGPQAQAEAESAQLQRFASGGATPQFFQAPGTNQQALEGIPPTTPPPAGDLTSLPDQTVSQIAAMSGVIGRLGQEELKRRREEQRQETESFKSTKDYREKLLEGYEGSKNTIAALDRMQELNDSGKLTAPSLAAIADRYNIPISVLSNPQSEEFQKLSQNLMKDIRSYYGSRINIVEVENFLKSIPTLTNSKEGRDRVIKNMKILLRPQELAYQAYKDIRKKKGKLPLDLHEQILEKIEPELNKLADEFHKEAPSIVIGIDPNGVRREIPRDKIEAFKKAGGTIE